MSKDFFTTVEEIRTKDARYKADAYEFVMHALTHTQKKLKRGGHVTGKELLEGIKEYGLELYGPLAKTVFSHWGVYTTHDFGQIVFNMVSVGLLGKTDEDTIDDFRDVYDFDDALDVFQVKKK